MYNLFSQQNLRKAREKTENNLGNCIFSNETMRKKRKKCKNGVFFSNFSIDINTFSSVDVTKLFDIATTLNCFIVFNEKNQLLEKTWEKSRFFSSFSVNFDTFCQLQRLN